MRKDVEIGEHTSHNFTPTSSYLQMDPAINEEIHNVMYLTK